MTAVILIACSITLLTGLILWSDNGGNNRNKAQRKHSKAKYHTRLLTGRDKVARPVTKVRQLARTSSLLQPNKKAKKSKEAHK